MGKVKKSTKRFSPPPPDCARLIALISSADYQDLPSVLESFQVWTYPRGDLHAWVAILDRFDTILENIIEHYKIKTLSPRPFDPTLTLHILRIQKLLLESCTNRKLFASYDRLTDLLLSRDRDIVQAALAVLIRPAQQYGSGSPISSAIFRPLKTRLLILARAENVRIDLKELASEEFLEGEKEVQIAFYRDDISTTVRAPVECTSEELERLALDNQMPLDDFFDLQYRISWMRALSDPLVRQHLLSIRLLAVASLWLLTADESTPSVIFLYNPTIITQLADLLSIQSDNVLASSVTALDACCRHRSKVPEILTAIGANLTHGPLLDLFRKTVTRLTGTIGPSNTAPSIVSYDFVDALLGFIGFISVNPNHSQLLVGAGIVPLLLDLLTTSSARRDSYVPRAAGLIDAFTAGPISQFDGINFLVTRVRAEITHCLANPVSLPTETLSTESLIFCHTSPLKAILRSLHRIMHSGVEGSRNLVDSDLPKSIKVIFEHSDRFGSRVFTQAINIMSSFVHNEPTSLSILQELQLPQTLFEMLEHNTPETYEVLSAVTTAVGAACLNAAGLAHVTAHPLVIDNLVAKSVRLDDDNGLEHIQHMGSALDELARHQPGLRAVIMKAVISQLDAATELGAAFVPNDSQSSDYDFASVVEPRVANNESLQLLTRIYKLLEGVLGNSIMCKDFLSDGLETLLKVADLPCVPVAFSKTEAITALTRTLRTIAQQDQVKLTDYLVNSILAELDRTEDFWKVEAAGWRMKYEAGPTSAVDQQFLRLPSLAIRLSLLSDVLSMSSWQGRPVTALLRSLQAPPDFLSHLAALHRASLRSHAEWTTDNQQPLNDEVVKDWPQNGAKFMATRIHAINTKLFKAMVKLLNPRRTSESGHRKEADKVAQIIGQALVNHLENGTEKSDNVVLGLTTLLLFDDRHTDGRLNLPLYTSFRQLGGVDRLESTAARILDRQDDQRPVNSGLRMLLLLLSALISPHALDSADKSVLVDTIQLRLTLLPIVRRIWSSAWLNTCPENTIKLAAKTFLNAMIADVEKESHTAPPATPAPIVPVQRVPPAPDPTRVAQLLDMGFSRNAAEFALIRARGSVAAAADLILSMPHLFQDDNAEGEQEREVIDEEQPNTASGDDAPPLEASPQEMVINDESGCTDTGAPLKAATPDITALSEQYEELRATYRTDLRERALELLDSTESLIFDLIPAFEGSDSLPLLFDRANEAIKLLTDTAGTQLSARLRMLAIVIRKVATQLDDGLRATGLKIMETAPQISTPRPSWTLSFLMFAETMISSGETIESAKIGDSPTQVASRRPLNEECLARLTSDVQSIIEDANATRDELLIALRLLTVITRQHPDLSILHRLLQLYQSPSSRLSGSHSYIAIILRHWFEDRKTLVNCMRRDIRRYLSRHKVTDVKHFVQQHGYAVNRDPQSFVEASEAECMLIDPTPAQAVYHVRAAEAQPVVQDDPFMTEGNFPDYQSTIDLLVRELIKLPGQLEVYAGLIISLLTELLGSYAVAKPLFVHATRRVGLKNGLSSIIQDLVCRVKLSEIDTPIENQVVSPVTLSSWTTSLLVALASEPGASLKEDLEAIASVRRSMLDGIVRVLKDVSPSIDVYYGKLWAIGELIQRLLATGPKQVDSNNVQIAKIMLEKNFVGLLTAAAGEIDLNYPGVRVVLTSLLKALDDLTKMSIKWSKAEKSKPQTLVEEEEGESSNEEDDDVEMSSEPEQAAPDLYRNSALGMLDMMEDDSDEEDELNEEEEEDMLDAYDEEMDDLDDASGTDPSSDELDQDGPEDWSDEDMDDEDIDGEDEDDMDMPEVVIGDPDSEADEWEDEEQDELGEDDMLSRDDDEIEFGDEGMFDLDEDQAEFDEMEEEYDDLDLIEPLPGVRHSAREREVGTWNWTDSRPPARDSGALSTDRATAALLGMPHRRSNAPHLAQPASMLQPGFDPALGSRREGTSRGDLYAAIEGMGGQHAVRLLESLLARSERNGLDAIRISFAQAENGTIDVSIGNRSFNLPRQATVMPDATTQDLTTECAPRSTSDRWQEESSLAPLNAIENQDRVIQHLINRLLPKAKIAAEKVAEADSDENHADAFSANRNATTDSDTEEDIEMLMDSQQVADDIRIDAPSPSIDGSNDGIEVQANESDSLARTIVSVRGQDVDITDSGIDLEFLQALPDDMRADVIEQHMREQSRARQPQPPAMPQGSTSISPEFLEALPPDIRAEIIMHQAIETSRRDASTAANSAQMPAVSRLLASLNSDLRGVMGITSTPPREPSQKKSQKEPLQLLEKPGIASLTRLLFFPDSFKKDRLFRILANLCENGTTRSELLNLLLSVLQDGSGDLPLVDRSFQQMSIKTMTTPKSLSKTKVVESPAPFASNNLFAHLQTDTIPSFIAQRCLEALTHILASNSRAVDFFLTEHEQGVGLRKTSKRGKGKEKLLPQTKFPIVILLSLLDRQDLLRTPGLMEHLTALLATVTRPLSSKPETDPALPSRIDTAPDPSMPPSSAKSSENTIQSDPTPSPTRYPSIPVPILRLVVNCLTTGECSSRNFSQTLIVLQNLSRIPDTQSVVLKELEERSQKLGRDIQDELHILADALDRPNFAGNDEALNPFSSPSSHQAQLLRLLKTIEYLHLNKVDSDPPGDIMTDSELAVNNIFQSFAFESMWNDLRRCLGLVEDNKSIKQIALVLLPLVESLMVICKYRRRDKRASRSPSVPPASNEDDLFLSFTTHHRKVLNAIVRNNPALLSGSFSLLIHNPRVLEFDNKRQWFFQKLKRKKDQTTHAASLHLNVRRQYVFQDSFDALRHRTGEEIKYGKIGVKFVNEDGIDAGGVTREWYSVLAQQIFDPNFALFEPCAADKQTYQPNKASAVNDDHLAYFKFIGRIIGKAVYDGRLLDAYFNRAFYKQILGRTVDMRDLESIDPEYHKSLQWMLENDITGVIDQEFTIEDDQFGESKIVELKAGGAGIPVTEENKEEYVRLVVAFRLDNSIKDQIKAFLDGFYEIIPRNLIQIFEPDQLELLISGMSTIDVDELRNSTHGWKSSDPEIGWFWRALRSFSQEERSRFLMFVTSSSRVPLGGFAQLQGASGTQPFQLQKLYAKEGSLPQASTCFNLLLLPTYASYEQLRERLQFAVTETGGFGKA